MSIAEDTPRRKAGFRFERWAPLILLGGALAIYVVVALVTGQAQYLTFDNLIAILGRSIALGITAIGQTFVILVASIDLSVASLISATAVLASVVMDGSPAMILPAILAAIALGGLVGLTNGLVVSGLKVNPLIATLGMSLIIQGCLSAFVSNFAGEVPAAFQMFAYGELGPFPVALLFLGLLAVMAWAVLRFTKFGSDIYAVGGNEEAARFAGIKTGRVVILSHVICSICASIAGLYLASRLRSGAPWIGSDGVYDLESIAVVVIGGTVLAGGRGGVWGTMAGMLIFSLIDSVFNIAGVDSFAKQVLRGIIIVAAVAFYAIRSKRIVA
ncbi:monosaccharide ABC transporter membrane protein, CUT2 family [Mameliella alba]|uniref:ABC transporter permease n=1 Tax=Mameliella alba TaxID=561184 RepID=UPI00087F83D5|nr:ABC transporter permease [Mameliella alba]OWV48790.1 ABC transporter permease [Mameliella alba]PTR39364.1 monosaccharide ABC transporter membrane protein (CUT2 family) [Mameliella alba]GGF65347.1 ABC transporter permease [Mameliella alba]SDD32218.1 monosaccharide ABC transporter membrane protein, CUT2 family [Mameliella alba]